MRPTKNYFELLDKRFKIFGLEGATRSGKTYGVMHYIITLYMEVLKDSSDKERFDVFAETVPVLKDGVMKDFKDIMREENIWDDNKWHETDKEYDMNGHTLKFIAIDKPGKAHGGERDRVFFNEAQNQKWEIVSHIMGRTKKQIIFDFNPVDTFWYHTQILENPDYNGLLKHITSNMFDNINNISEMNLRVILARARMDENYKRVYVFGKRGRLEGLIYSNWKLCDAIPEDYKWRRIGMDFGFTNDPTAIVDVRYAGGEIWEKELVYEPDLLPVPNIAGKPNIVDKLIACGITKDDIIYADLAEQKTIAQIKQYFPKIKGVKKPPGSVAFGIDIVKSRTHNVEKGSKNIIQEYRNWSWKKNPKSTGDNDKFLNEPDNVWKHGKDAVRYVEMEMFAGFRSNMRVMR